MGDISADALTTGTAPHAPAAATSRADRYSARLVGVGIGFISVMPVWVLLSRAGEATLGNPEGPIAALVLSIAIAATLSIVTGARLVRRLNSAGQAIAADEHDAEGSPVRAPADNAGSIATGPPDRLGAAAHLD